ncbi:hypothetical protein BJ508DRAFT_325096 [Ascobolus immersus RN42]|uniref:Uncharacterized protein n=1 Tax=Ascobolus immersus RN42 TaxID=1160509 RepID=A0A3N4IBW3_ASCIM|nr:hypothetical protein BJ508DRAFT_325096 [Ascobolus immersus RN42]
MNDVWLTVNPILTSKSEVSYFGVRHSDKTLFDDIDSHNAIILLADFALPIDALTGQADVRIHRHVKPDENGIIIEGPIDVPGIKGPVTAVDPAETSAIEMFDCCKMRHEDSSEAGIDVWNIITPENESKLDRFALFNNWARNFDHNKSTVTTNAESEAENHGPTVLGRRPRRKKDKDKPRPPSKPLNICPRVLRLVSAEHLPKTLAEDEIDAGEIGTTETISIPYDELHKRPRVITLCVDFYIDKFGVFRTTHRSSGAMYLTFHNMNYKGRDQVRNHFVVGFSPNGADTQVSAAPIIREIRQLSREGFLMNVDGEETRVYVKLLTVSADMAEAAGLAGCRGASALYPCRFCTLGKKDFSAESLSAPRADQQEQLRQVHSMRRFRDRCREANLSNSMLERALRTKGLKENRSVLETEGPAFNPYMQIALDISHSEQKGIGEKLIVKLVDVFLSKTGLRHFAKVLKDFKLPHGSSKIPNTSKRVKTLKMREVTLTIAMLPFILHRMDHNKALFKPSVLQRMNLSRPDDDKLDTYKLKYILVETFLAMAKANKLLFSREVPCALNDAGDPYRDMENHIITAREKIFSLLAPLEAYAAEEAKAKQKQQDLANQAVDEKLARDKATQQAKKSRRTKTTTNRPDTDDMDLDDDEAGNNASEEDEEDEFVEIASDDDDENEEDSSDSDTATQQHSRGKPAQRRKQTPAPKRKQKGKAKGKATRKPKAVPVFRKLRRVRMPNSLASLPNFHNAIHETPNSRMNGTSLNVSCSLGEMVHKIFKLLVAHSNYYELDLVFLRYINTVTAIRSIIDGARDKDGNPFTHPWSKHLRTIRKTVPTLCTGYAFGQIAGEVDDSEWEDEESETERAAALEQERQRLQDREELIRNESAEERYKRQQQEAAEAKADAAKLNIFTDDRFPIVKLSTKIGTGEANIRGLDTALDKRNISDDRLLQALWQSYEDYGFRRGRVSITGPGSRLSWWEQITVYDAYTESRYTYRPGFVIPIVETQSRGTGQTATVQVESFAEIVGICSHRADDGRDYVFLKVRWLKKVEDDDLFKLPRYQIQEWSDVHQQTTTENTANQWSNIVSGPFPPPPPPPPSSFTAHDFLIKATTLREGQRRPIPHGVHPQQHILRVGIDLRPHQIRYYDKDNVSCGLAKRQVKRKKQRVITALA